MTDSRKAANPVIWICIGMAIGICIKLFFIDFLRISGTSMEPSIHDKSVVLVNKMAYGFVKPGNRTFFVQWASPRPGDIVIYLHDNKIVIKRCAATGGTHLDYSADSGYSLHVGDTRIPLTKEQYDRMHASPRVPDGYILALGDNYAESIDSRSYGFVSIKNVVGRVIGK